MTTRSDLVDELAYYLDFIAAVMSIDHSFTPTEVFVDCWAQAREDGKIDTTHYGDAVVDAYGEIIEYYHVSDEVDIMDGPLELVRICKVLDALTLAYKERQ